MSEVCSVPTIPVWEIKMAVAYRRMAQARSLGFSVSPSRLQDCSSLGSPQQTSSAHRPQSTAGLAVTPFWVARLLASIISVVAPKKKRVFSKAWMRRLLLGRRLNLPEVVNLFDALN